MQVKVSYTDGLGTQEIVNSSPTSVVTNVNDAPTGTVNITGTPEQNQTLTATNTLFGYSLTLRESNIAAILLNKSDFKITFIWFFVQPLSISIKLYSLPLMLLFCRDSSHRQADALGGSPLTTIKIEGNCQSEIERKIEARI